MTKNVSSFFYGRGFLIVAGAGLSLFMLGFAVFAPRETIVRMFSDDAYYYLKIARNLATTGQASFDGITSTTGFHPLLGFLLAGFFRLGSYSLDGGVRVLLLLNVFAHLGTAAVLYGMGRDLRSPRAGWIFSLLYLTSPHSYLWILTGMESSVNALAVSGFLWCFLRVLRVDRDRTLPVRDLLFVGICGTFAVWARIDNVLLVALAGIPFLLRRGISFPTIWNGLVVFGLPLAGFVLWLFYCQGVVGEWVQGSARMKHYIREMDTAGLTSLEHFQYGWRIFQKVVSKTFFKVPVLVFLLPIWLWGICRRAEAETPRCVRMFLLLTPFAFALLFACTVDHPFTRYYVTPVMLWLVSGALYADRLFKEIDFSRVRTVRLALAFSLLLAIEGPGYLGSRMMRGRNPSQSAMLTMAEYLHQTLEPTDRIAAWNAGIYGYYSDLPVVNLDGLVNHDIYGLMKSGGSRLVYLEELDVGYLVDYRKVLEPFIQSYGPARFARVHEVPFAENRAIQVYRIKPAM